MLIVLLLIIFDFNFNLTITFSFHQCPSKMAFCATGQTVVWEALSRDIRHLIYILVPTHHHLMRHGRWHSYAYLLFYSKAISGAWLYLWYLRDLWEYWVIQMLSLIFKSWFWKLLLEILIDDVLFICKRRQLVFHASLGLWTVKRVS